MRKFLDKCIYNLYCFKENFYEYENEIFVEENYVSSFQNEFAINLIKGSFSFVFSNNNPLKSLTYIYFLWSIFTEFWVLYIKREEEVVHCNHLFRPFWKYPFAHKQKSSLILGPAYTKPDFRSFGLYKFSLKFLIKFSFVELKVRDLFIFAHCKNIPSIKGIESVGFNFCGKLKKDYLGRYILCGEDL